VIKLAIFDLDGTLVDSAIDIMHAANEVMDEAGLKPLSFETVRSHIGVGFGPFIREVVGERANDKEIAESVFKRFQDFYDKRILDNTTFFEGVHKFFSDFQKTAGSKMGIVSNKPEYQVRIILKGLGVQEAHLVQIYGGDTFDVKKPHPHPLQEMMRLADVTPSETVMIGDSRADVEAAKAAGTHCIAVSFGYNTLEALKKFGAQNFIHHFDELLPLIQSL
jgi:2-phosphoglycolate phosphatase